MFRGYAVAVLTCGLYGLLDGVPEAWVRALVRRCGAAGSDGLSLKGVLHSTAVGMGALGVWAAEARLNVVEPARSYGCLPPASSLGWLLPHVELGYALYDLLSALRLWDWTFAVHGVIASTMLLLVCGMGVSHHLSRVLVIHLSTIFLHLRRVDCGPRANVAIDAAFSLSFVLLRLVLLPWWWVVFLAHAYSTEPASWGSCMQGGAVVVAALLGGGVLHALNGYWGYLVVAKVSHKLRGGAIRSQDGVGRDAIESDAKSK